MFIQEKMSKIQDSYAYLLDTDQTVAVPRSVKIGTPFSLRIIGWHALSVREGPGCSWVIAASHLNQMNGSAPRAWEPWFGESVG